MGRWMLTVFPIIKKGGAPGNNRELPSLFIREAESEKYSYGRQEATPVGSPVFIVMT